MDSSLYTQGEDTTQQKLVFFSLLCLCLVPECTAHKVAMLNRLRFWPQFTSPPPRFKPTPTRKNYGSANFTRKNYGTPQPPFPGVPPRQPPAHLPVFPHRFTGSANLRAKFTTPLSPPPHTPHPQKKKPVYSLFPSSRSSSLLLPRQVLFARMEVFPSFLRVFSHLLPQICAGTPNLHFKGCSNAHVHQTPSKRSPPISHSPTPNDLEKPSNLAYGPSFSCYGLFKVTPLPYKKLSTWFPCTNWVFLRLWFPLIKAHVQGFFVHFSGENHSPEV